MNRSKPRLILGFSAILAVFLFISCPNQLMRDLVEQKLASPTADTFMINAGAPTSSPFVTLNSKVAKSNDALQMRFRNEGGAWTEWQLYVDSFPWTIPIGDAIKTVYAEYRDEGHHVVSMSGAIQLDTGAPVGPGFYAWGTGIAVGQQHNWINSISTTLMMNVAGANRMRFSNTTVANTMVAWDAAASTLPYAASTAWTLAPGDGAKTVYAQFLDAANNASYFTYAITLDTSAPTVGTALSINSSADAVFVPGVSLNASVSDNIAAAGQIYAEYQNDGEGWSSRAVLALPQAWSLRNEPGVRTVKARFTDIAGNVSAMSTDTIELSSGVPAPSAATPTNDTTPTWSWPPVNGALEYRRSFDNSTWTTLGTAVSYTPATPLSMGSYTLYVQARDSAGHWSASGSSALVLNTSGPGAPTVTSASALTNNSQPTWSWTSGGFGNGTYRYKLDNSDLSSGTTTTSATNVSPTLSDGTHILYVQENDNAGNWSLSGSFTTTVDTVAPAAPIVSTEPQTANTTPTWTWSASAGANNYRWSWSASGPWSAIGNTLSYTPVSPLSAGPYTLFVQSGDAAGNWSTGSGSAATIVYSRSVEYENASVLGSQLFGGRQTPPPAVSVGSGQSVSFPTGMMVKTFGFYFTNGFGATVNIQLDMRTSSGTIVATGIVNVPASFSGGWVYWTGLNYSVAATSSYVFTSFVQNATGTANWAGIRAEVSVADYPGSSYDCVGSSDAYMGTWSNWAVKSVDWDFWFRVYGD